MPNKERKTIEKTDWVSSFNLIGKPKITEYTFKIDEHSEKSAWIYNSMNLGIDCGEKYGVVYAEMMGGYSEEGQNVIYAHGKDENGNDDFSNKITVDFEDRFDESILEEIGDMCFVKVGIEKTKNGKTYEKKFLSAYDAIKYINKYLEEDMVLNVKGTLKYSEYNENTQVRKNITSIFLSKADTSDKYVAKFTQSILIDKYSVDLKNVNREKGIVYVDATVLDYVKTYNGIEVRGQIPYKKQFEFKVDFNNPETTKKIISKLFSVKKGYDQITFDGYFIEGGATVQATMEDVPDDLRELYELGMFTKEEVLEQCSDRKNKEYRMILRRPISKRKGEEDNRVTELQVFKGRYSDDDLYLDYLYEEKENESDIDNEEDDDDFEWLKDI